MPAQVAVVFLDGAADGIGGAHVLKQVAATDAEVVTWVASG